MRGGPWLLRARPVGPLVVGPAARASIVSERRITGLSQVVIADLVAESGPVWQARRDAELCDRPRRRSVGAGARHRPVFVDRLLATLVHLRHGITHDVLACWSGMDRSTVTRAVGEIRPLPAERDRRVAPGLRLRALARHHGRRGHPHGTVRAVAGLSSGQQVSHTSQLPALPAGQAT
ncbi:transposase family protein [Kitasatospora cineracea]|uniref:transposase family protein n=1 Tax=Kitasatospora cineracea TaxID=88074 RepID=UPI0037938512